MSYSREDYDKAIQEFCFENSGLTSYLVGEISHPGVSDLDFLVFNSAPKIPKSVIPFLMGGNVLIFPRFCAEKLLLIENFSLRFLQGEDGIVFEKPRKNHEIISIIEWLPERLCKIRHVTRNAQPDKLSALLHKSINRSIASVEKMTGKKYEIVNVDEARRSTATSWSSVLQQSFTAGTKAWHDFESYLFDAGLMGGDMTGSVSISQHYTCKNEYQDLLGYFHVIMRRSISNQAGSLNKKLCEKVVTDSSNFWVQEDLEKDIIERWLILENVYDWFVRESIRDGMVKYGWLI